MYIIIIIQPAKQVHVLFDSFGVNLIGVGMVIGRTRTNIHIKGRSIGNIIM